MTDSGMNRPLTFTIQYTKAADKFLKKHEDVRHKYEEALVRLVTLDHPEDIDVKKIRGANADYYRLRIGKCRIIYTLIRDRIVVVMTLTAGSRGDVYKKPVAK